MRITTSKRKIVLSTVSALSLIGSAVGLASSAYAYPYGSPEYQQCMEYCIGGENYLGLFGRCRAYCDPDTFGGQTTGSDGPTGAQPGNPTTPVPTTRCHAAIGGQMYDCD